MDTLSRTEALIKNIDPETVDRIKLYIERLCRESSTDLQRIEFHFDYVQDLVYRGFETSSFWKNVLASLKEWNYDYRKKSRFALFPDRFTPTLLKKPFVSFLLKTYRRNTAQVPDEEIGKCELKMRPFEWYSDINDIVRTTFVVKYLDGVELLRRELGELAQENGVSFQCELRSKQEGYYALHVEIGKDYSFLDRGLKESSSPIKVEMQVTTELQYNIKKILHGFYEISRVNNRLKKEETDWRWDYRCPEFRANYLGHILHYVDGMIMSLREEMKESG